MSLTNPNKVITEERLSEFYQSIFPYLGGMPDILANKFNKSDLYSTSEKMIGQWIDGKPLYQKTVTGTLEENNSWYSVTHNATNVENVIDFTGLAKKPNDDEWFRFNYFADANGGYILATISRQKIWLHNDSGKKNYTYAITFTYTKTTDSPVSVGNDTDYSTTEKIVGTWIDGKPLYQKTYAVGVDDLSNTSITSSMISGEIRIDSVSYDMIKIKDAFLTDLGSSNTSIRSNPLNYATSDKYIRANLQYDSKYFVYLELTYSVNSFYIDKDNLKFYVTIQYTKTTD